MSGRVEAEYRWALAHPDDPDARSFLSLKEMYEAHADNGALGLIYGVVADIRKKMDSAPERSA